MNTPAYSKKRELNVFRASYMSSQARPHGRPKTFTSLTVALLFTSLTACSPPLLLVRNSVAGPDGRTTLEGYIHRKSMFPFLHDIVEKEVQFLVGDKPVGQAVTDKQGTAKLPAVLGPDDQFIAARSKVDGKELQASAAAFHWNPNRVILVIDIDDTIVYTEVKRILGGRAPTLRPIEDSKETLVRLAERFQILYVTARPRRVLEATRTWLQQHGFPPGPVITSSGVTELVDIAGDKYANIMEIKKDWPALLIGIGNKASDAEAYGRSGMLAIIVRPQQEKDHRNHAIFMPTWYAIAKFFDANMETLADADQLREVLSGKKDLKLPVIGYQEGNPSQKRGEELRQTVPQSDS